MSGMKRHLEWYTQQRDQPLKDRTRFWTWNMRGLHGDMDTRYEGDKRTSTHNAAKTVTVSPDANGFNFRPLASNTYGYHPKSVTTRCNPAAGLSAIAGLQAERDAEKAAQKPDYLQNHRPDWSAPMKSLDDVMLMREPRPSRSSSLPRRSLRMPIDPALDDLINLRTRSENRPASTEALTEAEKALDTLRSFVGYTRPYDGKCLEALDSMEICLRDNMLH